MSNNQMNPNNQVNPVYITVPDQQEDVQEIDLVELMWVVLRKWWLILLLMVIGAGISYYVTETYVIPIYEAESTLFIGKESDVLANVSLSDFNLDNKLVVDYRELVQTLLVTEAVINDLALATTPEEIIKNLSIGVISESRFMHVSYKDPIPERAAIITNSLSEILAEKATDIVGVDNVQIVDYARNPSRPISPSLPRNMAIAAVLGAMVALGLIFIQMMMDDSVKTDEDVEKLIGATVIGTIPLFKGDPR